MNWPKDSIHTNGKTVEAIAPMIISASRSTDIPAFYAKEFVNCLKTGYLYWTNPFNGIKSMISLSKVKTIVFWTKNAEPIIPFLKQIDDLGITYYFNYTLNNYKDELLEGKLPSLNSRIDQFKVLSEKIGKEKVIWRYDPLVLLKNKNNELLLDKIASIAYLLNQYTNKLVVSFIDDSYQKVKNNFKKAGIEIQNLNLEQKTALIKKLHNVASAHGLGLFSCAETNGFDPNLIQKNKCIDDDLILKITPNDLELKIFISQLKQHNQLKDKGQRKFCGCMVSKDIGAYNTCFYSCVYCYAGHTKTIKTNIFK